MDSPADTLPEGAEGGAPRGGVGDRLAGLGLAAASLGLLLLAASLSPAAAGTGTHTQLGMPPCGFLAATGLPCATCGMTTATALAADGRLLAAGWTQPAGLLFALAVGALAWLGAWLAWSGRPAKPVFRGLLSAVFSGAGAAGGAAGGGRSVGLQGGAGGDGCLSVGCLSSRCCSGSCLRVRARA